MGAAVKIAVKEGGYRLSLIMAAGPVVAIILALWLIKPVDAKP